MSSYAMTHDSNPLTDSKSYYSREFVHMTLRELAAQGGRVTRVRFLSERMGRTRLFDLSYIHGELPNGQAVRLSHTPYIALATRGEVNGELISWCKEERVYGKGIGLFDQGNWSILY